jgi:hypothetical protein
MRGQWIKLAGIVLALMLTAIGCSPSATQPTPTLVPTATQPPPTPSPTATQPPPTPASPTNVEGTFPIGKFQNEKLNQAMTFIADGRWSDQGDTPSGGPLLGTFTVTGDQIIFKDDYCGDVLGTYTWSYDGEALSFKTIDDKCSVREYIIPSGKWLKQP